MRTVRLLLPALVLLAAATWAQTLRTIPEGATIKVRTDTAIPAKPAANARYTGTIAENVTDANGAVIIPRASRATSRARG